MFMILDQLISFFYYPPPPLLFPPSFVSCPTHTHTHHLFFLPIMFPKKNFPKNSSWPKDNATCGQVVARISRLVKTQRRLQGFQMRQAMLPFRLGMGVLASVLVASGQTLHRLGLEDFFGDQMTFSVPTMPVRFTKMVRNGQEDHLESELFVL